MGNRKEVAPEGSVQEQYNNIYPIQVTLTNGINDGVAVINKNTIVDSTQAIRISVEINDSRYEKPEVYESVKKACQKLLEYFH